MIYKSQVGNNESHVNLVLDILYLVFLYVKRVKEYEIIVTTQKKYFLPSVDFTLNVFLL